MPTDEIFNDVFMNEMMVNPDLYGLEEENIINDEEEINNIDGVLCKKEK